MQAARDAGALREAKDKLEKRVEELTWRLDFEKHLRVFSISIWLDHIINTKKVTYAIIFEQHKRVLQSCTCSSSKGKKLIEQLTYMTTFS